MVVSGSSLLCKKKKKKKQQKNQLLSQLKNMWNYCTGQSECPCSEQAPRLANEPRLRAFQVPAARSTVPRFTQKARMIFYIQCREYSKC